MMQLKMLSDTELKKLNTKRLLGCLQSARAVESHERMNRICQHWCCEVCKEWMLGPEEFVEMVDKPTAHLTAYKKRIKKILSTREHVKR
jgi:hypothetical protein